MVFWFHHSLIVPSAGASLLTNNLEGATYVLKNAGKAYYTLCQKGAWDKCLQQVPGESALIIPTGNPSDRPNHEIKCFNCGGPHHLLLCPHPRDEAAVDKNRSTHPMFKHRQPTSFKGNRPTRPIKWRFPEEGEHNKRIIDNRPFTYNPTTHRWEPDSTPDSGQQQVQVPAANVVPPTTPSAAPPSLPPTPASGSLPDPTKGAFFSGYVTPNMSEEKNKSMLALQMVHLKQVWENM
jgi:hypothetical protein